MAGKWERISDEAEEVAGTLMPELIDACANATDSDRDAKAEAREDAERVWREAWVTLAKIGKVAGWERPDV